MSAFTRVKDKGCIETLALVSTGTNEGGALTPPMQKPLLHHRYKRIQPLNDFVVKREPMHGVFSNKATPVAVQSWLLQLLLLLTLVRAAPGFHSAPDEHHQHCPLPQRIAQQRGKSQAASCSGCAGHDSMQEKLTPIHHSLPGSGCTAPRKLAQTNILKCQFKCSPTIRIVLTTHCPTRLLRLQIMVSKED